MRYYYKEESYLHYTTIVKYVFCLLIFFYFSSDKLAEHTSKNVFVLFSSSNLLSLSVTITEQKKRECLKSIQY